MKRIQRLRARGIEKILILDRGNVELGVPKGWSVESDPEGFVKLKDPTESCMLELSYLRLPPPLPSIPPLRERLRLALEDTAEAAGYSPIVLSERPGIRLAWAEYVYDCDDTDRGERRKTRGRWLLAANDTFQALLTYCYWADDARWAAPVWEKIVETLELGNGIPLESPKDHWSLREED
ncbi:MAG: hypothetical protein ACE5JD_15025 [Candidatus Methylomirabilia bacterium]